MIQSTASHTFSEISRECIQRIEQYKPEEQLLNLSSQSASKHAAVLVLLYEDSGELRVLLTTRSKKLRSHPGETALPGGKVDEVDKDVVHTAHREAYEEVGLPLDCPYVQTLAVLEPFISRFKLLVTPVIAFLSDTSVLDSLQASEAEVDRIFTYPLKSILDPSIASKEPLVAIGGEHWPYGEEFYNSADRPVSWLGEVIYRTHRFRTAGSPITGLTSDVLIRTAEIAYAKESIYERWPPNQAPGFAYAFRSLLDA